MIPDFTTKMLRLKNMRKGKFSWSKIQQKAFGQNEKWVICYQLLQPISLRNEATVTTDASEKVIAGFFCRTHIHFFKYWDFWL